MNNLMLKFYFKNQKNKSGFSLMETIIYFALLAVITALVSQSIISLFKNYNIVKANQDIEYNAINIFDKLSRDTHDAKNILISQSSFSSPFGVIALNISSSTDINASNTIKYYLEDSKIKYMKDGIYLGNLSTNSVNVSNFKIFYINSSSTESIKVEMNLEVTPHLSSSTISKNFYTTIQLRQ